jgi:hypothetical protein
MGASFLPAHARHTTGSTAVVSAEAAGAPTHDDKLITLTLSGRVTLLQALVDWGALVESARILHMGLAAHRPCT